MDIKPKRLIRKRRLKKHRKNRLKNRRRRDNFPITFSDSELGPVANTFIKGVERIAGRRKIARIYNQYLADNRPPHLVWQDAVERFSITVKVNIETGAAIPPEGPVLIVANHPFGIVDGVVLCSEVSKIRNDYKLIAHEVLQKPEPTADFVLPINFEETIDAEQTNMQTRHAAIKQIQNGGLVVLFPAGAISLPPNLIGTAIDAEWKTFAAKLALMNNATTVPVFFHGQNSVSYLVGRRISQTLGYSMMFREVARRMGKTVTMTIRKPIACNDLKSFENRSAVTAYLRAKTYGLDGQNG